MRIRHATTALGLLAAIGVWPLVGGDFPVFALALGLFTFSPWAFLAFGARSFWERDRQIALGVIVAMTAATYMVVIQDDSSTTALAFLFLPGYQWAALGIIGLIIRLRRRDSNHGDQTDADLRG